MMNSATNLMSGRSWILGFFVVAGAAIMLPNGQLHDFGTVPVFLSGAAVMLVGFFTALRFPPQSTLCFWAVALISRSLLLWQEPGADIFRYIWEGRNLLAGWNPYAHAPDADSLVHLRDAVWDRVQHRQFSAIYPPLAEWIFALTAGISQSAFAFKFVIASADVAVVWLLLRRFGISAAIIYAWNPIVIYSFAGGGHYDSLFVLALVLGWFAWLDNRPLKSAVWFGAALALKWLALPILAWVLWRVLVSSWKNTDVKPFILATLAGAAPLVVSFVALSVWTGEWSFQLLPPKFSDYARSAEFIPAIVGEIWPASRHFNKWVLYPVALGWSIVILGTKSLDRAAERALAIAFLFSPMVHIWYFTWLIPFATQTRNLGTLLVTASGFVYFMLYHNVEAPQGMWQLSQSEFTLLWIPFAVGLLLTEWNRWKRRAGPPTPAHNNP